MPRARASPTCRISPASGALRGAARPGGGRCALSPASPNPPARHDVLLTPVAPVKPFPVEMNFPAAINGRKLESYIDWIAPTFLVTLVSLPAGSVPAGLTADGLPVGMQIVAPRFEEPLILRVARLAQPSSGVGWPPAAVAPQG